MSLVSPCFIIIFCNSHYQLSITIIKFLLKITIMWLMAQSRCRRARRWPNRKDKVGKGLCSITIEKYWDVDRKTFILNKDQFSFYFTGHMILFFHSGLKSYQNIYVISREEKSCPMLRLLCCCVIISRIFYEFWQASNAISG